MSDTGSSHTGSLYLRLQSKWSHKYAHFTGMEVVGQRGQFASHQAVRQGLDLNPDWSDSDVCVLNP